MTNHPNRNKHKAATPLEQYCLAADQAGWWGDSKFHPIAAHSPRLRALWAKVPQQDKETAATKP